MNVQGWLFDEGVFEIEKGRVIHRKDGYPLIYCRGCEAFKCNYIECFEEVPQEVSDLAWLKKALVPSTDHCARCRTKRKVRSGDSETQHG